MPFSAGMAQDATRERAPWTSDHADPARAHGLELFLVAEHRDGDTAVPGHLVDRLAGGECTFLAVNHYRHECPPGNRECAPHVYRVTEYEWIRCARNDV